MENDKKKLLYIGAGVVAVVLLLMLAIYYGPSLLNGNSNTGTTVQQKAAMFKEINEKDSDLIKEAEAKKEVSYSKNWGTLITNLPSFFGEPGILGKVLMLGCLVALGGTGYCLYYYHDDGKWGLGCLAAFACLGYYILEFWSENFAENKSYRDCFELDKPYTEEKERAAVKDTKSKIGEQLADFSVKDDKDKKEIEKEFQNKSEDIATKSGEGENLNEKLKNLKKLEEEAAQEILEERVQNDQNKESINKLKGEYDKQKEKYDKLNVEELKSKLAKEEDDAKKQNLQKQLQTAEVEYQKAKEEFLVFVESKVLSLKNENSKRKKGSKERALDKEVNRILEKNNDEGKEEEVTSKEIKDAEQKLIKDIQKVQSAWDKDFADLYLKMKLLKLEEKLAKIVKVCELYYPPQAQS